MSNRPDKPTFRIVVKYFLLQLPDQTVFALILFLSRQLFEFPASLAWGLFALWVGKDIFLFPFLWRFYDPSQHLDRFQMVGRKGFTLSPLSPDGYVQVRGERWKADLAEGQSPIEKGETICVKAINGLKLTVKTCAED